MITPDWKIYYGTGETFSSDDGPPESAPCTGVVAVAYYNIDNQRAIWSEKAFYWYDEKPPLDHVSITKGGLPQWFGGDEIGYYQYMFVPGKKIVKFGQSFHDAQWRLMLGKVLSDLPKDRAIDFTTKPQ